MQISLFDGTAPFRINKPIRLIELFAGYGSQHLSLKYLGANVESYRICEWAVKSIQAYKDLHFGDDNTDYSEAFTVDEVIDYLANKGISANYNSPMTREQVKRMGEDKCRQVYNNIKATHNLVNIMQAKASDLEIVERDKYCYVLTYSFPCQDLSKAGLGKGMAKDSGTRSGLLWEVERILDECNGNLPQVLLMENVPDVIGTKNVSHFAKWLEKLESIGYKCYWKVLNGKDYGIPQNRERCFMVSILGDYFYDFPQPIKLEKRLKDLLETEVDEKYYLSDRVISSLEKHRMRHEEKGHGFGWKPTNGNGVANTIKTESGYRPASNFIKETPKCIQVDLQQTVKVRKYEVDIEKLKATLREHKISLDWSINSIAEYLKRPKTEVEHWFRNDNCFSIPDPDIWLELKDLLDIETDEFDKPIMEFETKPNEFDMANRAYHENGLSPTITTQETPKCIQVGMLSGGKWDKMHDQSRRYYSVDGTAPTIPTSCGGNHEPKIAEPKLVGGIGEKKSNGGTQYYQQDRVYDSREIAMCHPANLPTGSYNYLVETKPNLKQKLCNDLMQSGLLKEGDVVNHSYTNGGCGKNPNSRQDLADYIESTNGVNPTLTTRPDVLGVVTNYRIRKLTPKECWRLMGVKDEDFEKVAKNQSNSSLYHLAGDSIITNVLMAIFKNILGGPIWNIIAH